MDERDFLDVISGRRAGAGAVLMRAGLSLLTPWYRTLVGVRNGMFDAGMFRVHRVDVPVVSVGNLTTGGTGKTPMVAWLVDWFASHDRSPCIVSRGYRSLDESGNDERRVLEQLCPGVPHVQNRDRVAAARSAVDANAPGVLILDDGFQHRRLGRDVDLVLIDALNPWGYGRMLPRGLLREPKSSLRRADAVIVTRADQVDASALSGLRSEIARWTQALIAEVAFRPQRLLSIGGESRELTDLNSERVSAFCGIGNPEGFRRTLQDAGFQDVQVEAFADHHHYTADELRQLTLQAIQAGSSALVTTQKDHVKLRPEWQTDLPVWGLVIGAEVIAGRQELEGILTRLL